jgi:hypothetical protein
MAVAIVETRAVTGGVDTHAIFLRPGTQGTGIEVHEAVHTLCNAEFEAKTSFFLSEGITEYFTRLATAGSYDRGDAYDTEHFFVDQLVKQNASTPQILANLYFGGDWNGFEQGLYGFAELVSIQTLLNSTNASNAYATMSYLEELEKDPEAPLRKYQKQ